MLGLQLNMVNFRLNGKFKVKILVLCFPSCAEVTFGNKLVKIHRKMLLTKDGDRMITWEQVSIGGVSAEDRRGMLLKGEAHI